MKKLSTLIVLFIATISFSQNSVLITAENYNLLKQNGQLLPNTRYIFPSFTSSDVVYASQAQIQQSKTRSSVCNCLIDLDSSFMVVPFTGGVAPDFRNDDFSTDKIALPFSFNFYGVQYDSLYINNNGNISFNAPYFEFTANPFPDFSYNMIAPFWGDVDTRDSMSGLVYYKITPSALIVKWENVGYFDVHSDLTSTFQLIITNGNDSIIPNGNNVSFCYGDMNWTTGDASNGVGGFGGAPATVGVNQGDGVNYFQVGTFDATGTTFDGPYNLTDQVDFLDNQEVYFNLANSGNVPPLIINNYICDTIDIYTGDTLKKSMFLDSLVFAISVATPEIDQNVFANITCSVPNNFSYSLTQNTQTFKEYTCVLDVRHLLDNENSNLVYININANDDGFPVESSTQTIVVRVNYEEAKLNELSNEILFSVSPNPMSESISIQHSIQLSENPIVTITDLSGKNIKTEKLTSFDQTIYVSELNSGIYLISILSNNGNTQNMKIIKE